MQCPNLGANGLFERPRGVVVLEILNQSAQESLVQFVSWGRNKDQMHVKGET